MQRQTKLTLAALSAAGFLGAAFLAHAADKPKYTVKVVMQALHNGDDALAKKVMKGEGTHDDFKKLVEN